MFPRLTAPIRAGSLEGVLFWHVENGSFGASLRSGIGHEPTRLDRFGGTAISNCDSVGPSHRRSGRGISEADALEPDTAVGHAFGDVDGLVIGGRPAEFPTIDRLLNHLALLGLVISGEAVEIATTLRARVTATFGDVELVGIDRGDRARLLLALPNGRTVALNERRADPLSGFGWGGGRAETMDTARALLAAAWSTGWGSDEEMCAEALAYGLLAEAGPSFSVTANSLCDWFLLDGELTTALTDRQLREIATYQDASTSEYRRQAET